MPDDPWGHHAAAAQTAHSDLAVANPSDVSPTWVEQLEVDLEFDEESIPEEVGQVIRGRVVWRSSRNLI
ncbi:uncharacterized protein DS421_4g118860 [Arachis hypogaea]|nr:uncharacterized protein DS421_4g118860 [Arachis hypogaea]